MFVGFFIACAPEPGPPSVVLVSFDTTRADRFGAYGNTDGLTPNLDAFAAESVVFDHAYSQANATGPSHASLFTSRWPPSVYKGEGVTFGSETPTLADVLRVHGYQTAAFVGGGALSAESGLTSGFDTYVSPVNFGSFFHTVPKFVEWLEGVDIDRPFFAFVHGYDAHAPYLKPTPFGYMHGGVNRPGVSQPFIRSGALQVASGHLFPDIRIPGIANSEFLRVRTPEGRARMDELAGNLAKVNSKEMARIADAYDGGISYADAWFGALLRGLEERGVLDRALVVVIADHGEELGESGWVGHCCDMGDASTHVPLIARMPGGQLGGRHVDGVVQLTDVLPSILELAGMAAPVGIVGESFAPALRGEAFDGREMAFSTGGYRGGVVSVRTRTARLTWTGPSLQNSMLLELLGIAALPGPGFTGSPDPALRDALVRWVRDVNEIGTARRAAPPAAFSWRPAPWSLFPPAPRWTTANVIGPTLARMDMDHDGRVTQAEYERTRFEAPTFPYVDGDGDGEVGVDDLQRLFSHQDPTAFYTPAIGRVVPTPPAAPPCRNVQVLDALRDIRDEIAAADPATPLPPDTELWTAADQGDFGSQPVLDVLGRLLVAADAAGAPFPPSLRR